MSTIDGSPDDGLTIRAALRALAAKSVGGSFRYAVNTSLAGGLQVQLQTLPAPLAVVEGSPILLADNVAVVNLFSWDLVVYGFDEDDIKGPQPILCIEEPDEASGHLSRASEAIKLSHNRLMKR